MSGNTVAYWLRFKGFYTQVWGSNPRLCNLLQITENPGFKSRRELFIKQLCQTTEERLTKDLQHGASKSCQAWIFIGRHR